MTTMKQHWRRVRYWFLPAAGFITLVVGVVLINQHANIAYPLSTWRVDLDDALIGLGTILIGTAAIWTVWLKAKAANERVDAVERKLNGGLSNMASQIMMDEIKQAGIDTTLAKRVATVETRLEDVTTQRDDCLERVAQQDALIEAIHQRLDQNGMGRDTPR